MLALVEVHLIFGLM